MMVIKQFPQARQSRTWASLEPALARTKQPMCVKACRHASTDQVQLLLLQGRRTWKARPMLSA